MDVKSLKEVYKSVDGRARTIFVVPLIRFTHQKTDYLYLLYKELLEDEEFEIKSISVFNHFKLVMGILSKKNAILHYHWLEFQDLKSLAGMPWKMLCIALFKLLGGKIVWTLHNEFPHDRRFLGLHVWLHKRMAKWAHKLHVHCASAIPLMSKRLQAPKHKFFVQPHPVFPSEILSKKQAVTRLNEEIGLNLNPETPILLMFGNISRYKQIEQTAKIVISLPIACTLLIVGPIKKGNLKLYKELLQLSQQSERIILIPKFVKEEHVPLYQNAADLCVFNYREILSSGGVNMALSYNNPIIAPDKGCISELAGNENVYLFNTEQEMRAGIIQFLEKLNVRP